jgi:recombination protein RecA
VYHQLAANTARLAPKLYADVRLQLEALPDHQPIDQARRKRVQVRIVKNSFSPGCFTINVDFMYNDPISLYGELLDLGIQSSTISRQGRNYFFRGQPIGMGDQAARLYLSEHPDLADEIEKDIRQRGLPPSERERWTNKTEP